MESYVNVGKRFTKIDAIHKAIGELRYTSDIYLPHMLFGKILRSPYPHANVKKIDFSEASRIPGVQAILTFKDVPKLMYAREFALLPGAMVRDNFILEEKARFVGDKIAAVAASNRHSAERAIESMNVEYERLPAVFEPMEAMKPSAAEIHQKVFWGDREATVENNVCARVDMQIGNIEKGFIEAEVTVEKEYRVSKAQQSPLERRCCIVKPEPDGRLSVWSTTQSIHGLRQNLAAALDIPLSRIRVNRTFLGGAFGSRLDMNIDEPITALLAIKTGQPVRIDFTREEDMTSTSRHPAYMKLKTGAKKDGSLVAQDMLAVVDTGAYGVSGEWVTKCMGGWFLSMYRAENQRFTGSVVYTNTPPSAAFRGFGNPQANFAVESQMDILAEELQIDPVDLRLKNYVRQGDLFFGQGPNVKDYIRSCGVEEIVTTGAEKIGWHRRKNLQNQDGVVRKGIGMARAFHTSGCGSPNPESEVIEYSGAIVKFNQDGTANVVTALVDMGTGNLTGLAQIVAEELGIRFEDVIVSEADTDVAPYDVVTHASRSIYVAGGVARVAAAHAKKVMLEMAARLLEARVEDLEVKDRIVNVKGAPQKTLNVSQVTATAHTRQWGTIMGEASFRATTCPPHFTVKFVEVEVDMETGEVKVDRVVAGADVGQPINPTLIEGQLHGGIQQGIGYALMENIYIDTVTGQPLNLDYLNYKMLTARDSPSKVEVFLAKSLEATGPFGAKGIGESSINDVAAAVANAIYNATGVRITELPITSEKILREIKKTAA